MFQQKLTTLSVLLVGFVVSSLIAPLSAYAISISPSIDLSCGSNNLVNFFVWITNNEPSDTVVVSMLNNNFSGELEAGTIAPGQKQLASVQIGSQSIPAGAITFKYFKQNNSGTVETQSVGYGSFSCPLPSSAPTPTTIVLPTNIPTPTPTSIPATPVPQSTETNSSTGNTGVTNTPVPTQKPTNTPSNDSKQDKPFFGQTNNSKSDEKEQKNNGDKQTHQTTSAVVVSTTKVNKHINTGFFGTIKNIFEGFFSFLNPFKGPHSKN